MKDYEEFGDFSNPKHRIRRAINKRFGRGAFGEVWLAFNWNCTEGSNASNGGLKNGKCSFNTIHLDNYDRNSQANSSARDFYYGAPDDDLFILKRIMF
ncbi:hypothetical protein CsSME_00047069 [Camellia sinensis var. sinensis]